MKYIILIGDGMADHPIESLGGKTPLEVARTPHMDSIASRGSFGLFKSVPQGYPPGSDVANLSILGYDPKKYFTGRSPLEAANIGVDLTPTDVAFRCNLVTLLETDDGLVMGDYSAGHISTEEAREIIFSLDYELAGRGVKFYPGTSYRHLMVWEGGRDDFDLTPPHDISDRTIEAHLPKGDGAQFLLDIMDESRRILSDHPVNITRNAQGKNKADSVWLWGQGRAPVLPTFGERFSITGSMISAVDLMKGIGIYAGLDIIDVPGMTGYIDTNYEGKASSALRSLMENDFVCLHVEAPDEAGHQGSIPDKIKAIEDFDALIVGKILEGLQVLGDYRLLVLPDHYTPVELKTHTSEPVPFAMVKSDVKSRARNVRHFTEKEAALTGTVLENADEMAREFFG